MPIVDWQSAEHASQLAQPESATLLRTCGRPADQVDHPLLLLLVVKILGMYADKHLLGGLR